MIRALRKDTRKYVEGWLCGDRDGDVQFIPGKRKPIDGGVFFAEARPLGKRQMHYYKVWRRYRFAKVYGHKNLPPVGEVVGVLLEV